mgnify:FL=1
MFLFSLVFFVNAYIPAQPRASSWDGAVLAVKDYLKNNAHDPKSIKIVECSYIFEMSDGYYYQRVKYRGNNAFGASVLNEHYFQIRGQGDNARVTRVYSKEEFNILDRSGNFKIIRQYDANGKQIRL